MKNLSHAEQVAYNFRQNSSFDDGLNEVGSFDDAESFYDEYDEAANMYDENDEFLGGIFNPAKAIMKKVKKRKEKKRARAELQRQQAESAQAINNVAANTGISPEAVALQNVQQNAGLIGSYVQQAGQTPQQNPAALALQATQVYQQQVENKQGQGIPDYEAAGNSHMEDMQDSWGEEADEFFGAIISSVFKAGKALVETINKKREAKGKKPLFAGKNWQKLAEKINNNESVVTDALTANERALLALTRKELDIAKQKEMSPIGAATDAFILDQKKQAFMSYLPYILIAAVLLFFIGRKSA